MATRLAGSVVIFRVIGVEIVRARAEAGVVINHFAIATTHAAIATAHAAIATTHAVVGGAIGILSSGAGSRVIAAGLARRGGELLKERLAESPNAD